MRFDPAERNSKFEEIESMLATNQSSGNTPGNSDWLKMNITISAFSLLTSFKIRGQRSYQGQLIYSYVWYGMVTNESASSHNQMHYSTRDENLIAN